MSSEKRLNKELERIKEQATEGIHFDIERSTTYKWYATIEGPEGTPFEGGDFRVTMEFPNSYPFKPPKVKFLTKVYHPNVYSSGDICLDILQDQWQPTYTGEKTLLSIQSLFSDPNPASPANSAAGKLFSESRKKYDAEVRRYVQKHAAENQKKRLAKKLKKMEEEEKNNKDKDKDKDKDPKDTNTSPDTSATTSTATRGEKRKRNEDDEKRKSPDERIIEELTAAGFTDTKLIKSLLPVVQGNVELLKSLYNESSK